MADPPRRNKQWSQYKLEGLVLKEFLAKFVTPYNLGLLTACNLIDQAELGQHLGERLELAKIKLADQGRRS